jgi:ribonuclease HI
MHKSCALRAWTIHNNITYNSGPSSLSDSIFSLLNLRDSCIQAKLKYDVVSSKGKEPRSASDNRAVEAVQQSWAPPAQGWIKINVDGSFVEQTGDAGVGLVARDHNGTVIFTAWRAIERCSSAYEAEAMACAEGLRLAAQWSPGSIILESDCARAIDALRSKEDRSKASFIVAEAREHAQLLSEWCAVQVNRGCNSIAHDLAHLATSC